MTHITTHRLQHFFFIIRVTLGGDTRLGSSYKFFENIKYSFQEIFIKKINDFYFKPLLHDL